MLGRSRPSFLNAPRFTTVQYLTSRKNAAAISPDGRARHGGLDEDTRKTSDNKMRLSPYKARASYMQCGRVPTIRMILCIYSYVL